MSAAIPLGPGLRIRCCRDTYRFPWPVGGAVFAQKPGAAGMASPMRRAKIDVIVGFHKENASVRFAATITDLTFFRER